MDLFWLCDGKRETRTSCDNWNDRRKMQQGKQREKMLDGPFLAM